MPLCRGQDCDSGQGNWDPYAAQPAPTKKTKRIGDLQNQDQVFSGWERKGLGVVSAHTLLVPTSDGPQLRLRIEVVLYLERVVTRFNLSTSGSPSQAPIPAGPINHITLGPHLTLLRYLLQFPITQQGHIQESYSHSGPQVAVGLDPFLFTLSAPSSRKPSLTAPG